AEVVEEPTMPEDSPVEPDVAAEPTSEAAPEEVAEQTAESEPEADTDTDTDTETDTETASADGQEKSAWSTPVMPRLHERRKRKPKPEVAKDAKPEPSREPAAAKAVRGSGRRDHGRD